MIVHPVGGFAVKPTLTGTTVVLRPFAFEQDAPALREMLQDPEVIRLTGSSHDPAAMPEWDAAESTFRDWYSTRNDQTDRLDLAVVDKASAQCVGEVVLNEWNEPNRSCNFRTIIGPRGQDRGLGTEASPAGARPAAVPCAIEQGVTRAPPRHPRRNRRSARRRAGSRV